MPEGISHSEKLNMLLVRAQEGDREALGELLDLHRPYLKMMARRFLGRQLQARLDESDLIQQTCLSAFRNFNQYNGDQGVSFLVWLKQIHERNIQDCLRRHLETAKRSVRREEQLPPADLAQAATETASPSRRLMGTEEAVRLAEALQTLPEDQQEAVRLRHLEGWPLGEIARQLDRSEQAVSGLLKRGIQKLREQLASDGK